MQIAVTCQCGKHIDVDEQFGGTEVPCPSCGRRVWVPIALEPLGGGEKAKEFLRNRAAAQGSATGGAKPGWQPNAAGAGGAGTATARGPAPADFQPRKPATPRRPILEILLDPRSIQWMLTLGGALMVIGLIIWLASFEFFQKKEVVAVALGTVTIAVLAAGWFMALKTRYRIVGQALAFLACVAAALNLWFYHSYGLITLEGHLWVAGVVCCLLYAATAYALRDPLFMYAVEGGVTLTMLLLLAELDIATQMPALSIFLVVLGVISIHAERVFAPEEGDFSRRRFGMPLFWSGQAQLAVGLLIMLAAQTLDWSGVPVTSLMGYEWGALTSESFNGFPLLPMVAWLAGAYACLYSDLVVRRIGVYTVIAAACILMAEVTVIAWQRPDPAVLIVVLALTALAANGLRFFLSGERERLRRALAPMGVALSVLPLFLGVVLHIRATSELFQQGSWHYPADWSFVGAMVLVALSSRASAYLYRGEKAIWSAIYFFISAGALLIGAAGLLHMLEVTRWTQQAPLLMVIPIAYMAASWLWRGRSPEKPLASVAQVATVVLLVPVVLDALDTVGRFTAGDVTNLWRAAFFAEAAIFFGLTAAIRRRGANIYLAAVMGAGALWQVLAYFNTPEPYYAVVFAGLGLLLLLVYRGAGQKSFESRGLALPAFQCGNAALTAGFVAALLQALARLAIGEVRRIDLTAALITTAVSLLAAWLVRVRAWKRWYVTTTIGLGALSFVMVQVLSTLSAWQKLEIFCVCVGVALLATGYVSRLREETDRPNDLVSLCLWLGSILAVVPLLAAVLTHRFAYGQVSLWDEVALLTLTMAMVFSGYILQFKSSTLIGGAGLVSHLIILIVFVGMMAQLAVGVYLAAGGAAVFALGIGLAVYREKLLALPGRIKNHEGLFKVLGWR